jgi:hypothetical protein
LSRGPIADDDLQLVAIHREDVASDAGALGSSTEHHRLPLAEGVVREIDEDPIIDAPAPLPACPGIPTPAIAAHAAGYTGRISLP